METTKMDILQEIHMLKQEMEICMTRMAKNIGIIEQMHSKVIEILEKEISSLKNPQPPKTTTDGTLK